MGRRINLRSDSGFANTILLEKYSKEVLSFNYPQFLPMDGDFAMGRNFFELSRSWTPFGSYTSMNIMPPMGMSVILHAVLYDQSIGKIIAASNLLVH